MSSCFKKIKKRELSEAKQLEKRANHGKKPDYCHALVVSSILLGQPDRCLPQTAEEWSSKSWCKRLRLRRRTCILYLTDGQCVSNSSRCNRHSLPQLASANSRRTLAFTHWTYPEPKSTKP